MPTAKKPRKTPPRRRTPVKPPKPSEEQLLKDAMGQLHNRFVAFITEAQLPLPHVIMVLDMLRSEAVELARKTYLGE